MNNIEVVKANIVELDVDIIVNAANKTLLGGGGVDGAIHRAAGRELLEECKTLGGCNTGDAKMTDGYNLPAKKVIHAVGPIYHGKEDDYKLLESVYAKSMILAEEYRTVSGKETTTIAFPCISTGVYHFPKEEACKIAVDTIKKINNKNVKVIFVCFDNIDYDIYVNYLGIY